MRTTRSLAGRVCVAAIIGFVLVHCGAGTPGGGGGGAGGTSTGGEQNGTQDTFGDDAGSLGGDDGATTSSTDAGFGPVADAGGGTVVTNATQDFPIAPLHLTPTRDARDANAQVDVELRADGTIYSHGQLVGQFSGRRVVSPTGREILAIQTDGTVTLGGTPTRARLLEDGTMQMPTGAIMTFADDGTPVTIAPNQQRQQAPARIIGYRDDLRRTAALLAVLAATVSMPH